MGGLQTALALSKAQNSGAWETGVDQQVVHGQVCSPGFGTRKGLGGQSLSLLGLRDLGQETDLCASVWFIVRGKSPHPKAVARGGEWV